MEDPIIRDFINNYVNQNIVNQQNEFLRVIENLNDIPVFEDENQAIEYMTGDEFIRIMSEKIYSINNWMESVRYPESEIEKYESVFYENLNNGAVNSIIDNPSVKVVGRAILQPVRNIELNVSNRRLNFNNVVYQLGNPIYDDNQRVIFSNANMELIRNMRRMRESSRQNIIINPNIETPKRQTTLNDFDFSSTTKRKRKRIIDVIDLSKHTIDLTNTMQNLQRLQDLYQGFTKLRNLHENVTENNNETLIENNNETIIDTSVPINNNTNNMTIENNTIQHHGTYYIENNGTEFPDIQLEDDLPIEQEIEKPIMYPNNGTQFPDIHLEQAMFPNNGSQFPEIHLEQEMYPNNGNQFPDINLEDPMIEEEEEIQNNNTNITTIMKNISNITEPDNLTKYYLANKL
jgi:hypothetical protein